MRGEIIAIGDELTSGQRLDTNTQWLAERLTDTGVEVLYHTTVGDDLQANVLVFCHAIERADVVVTTGGLGPTADDLTRDALAAAAGVELVTDEASLERIRQMFVSRGRQMPQKNELQALFPSGARPIHNEHGTAPGVLLTVPREGRRPCTVFALPGVPAEMMPMWDQTVAPAIAEMHENPRVIRHRRIKCFGVGESHLEEMLPDMIARDREPRVGITVSKATITLRITAMAETEQECYAAMAPTIQIIRDKLGSLVFGEEDQELQHVVVRELVERSQTLAAADAVAHGLLPQWLSEADPAGMAFLEGQVTNLENPDEAAVARAAEELRGRHQTDFALVLGPANKTHAIESVAVALAYDGGVLSKVYPNAGHPDIADDRAAKLALNVLRKHLMAMTQDTSF
jgi:nicotinamide-nucleotide amidase